MLLRHHRWLVECAAGAARGWWGGKKEAQRAATDDNTRLTPLGNTIHRHIIDVWNWFLHSASLIYHHSPLLSLFRQEHRLYSHVWVA